MAIFVMFGRFLTKKSAPNATEQAMTHGMVVSVSGAEELARCQEKTTTIKLASSIPHSGGMLLYHLASIF